MAITGIDTIEGKQIIAAGAVSAKSAEMAYNDENGNPITGYLTAVPEGYATTEDLTSYQLTADMTGYQVAGDYYSASNPSGFITGVDLSDYATTAQLADKQDITGMTAYQPVGNYQTAGDYLTTADSANFYTTANESGFITGVPDTYLQNTDLTITDGKITEISGVPLSAGDELPETVSAATDYITANSATINCTVETVSSNSGSWGGEALPLSSRDGIDLEIAGDMLYIGASALTASINEKLDSSVYAMDSGSFLTAIPSDIMNESAFEYDANNKISAYNGSAFAGGSNYTAGTGIDITNNTISVDTAVIATVDMVSAVSSMIGDIESALANL